MIHVTCDSCGLDLCNLESNRFVVKIEIYAAQDPTQLTDDDLDEDSMQSLSEALRAEKHGFLDSSDMAPTQKSMRYDLCPDCHERFLKDPLSRQNDLQLQFSEN